MQFVKLLLSPNATTWSFDKGGDFFEYLNIQGDSGYPILVQTEKLEECYLVPGKAFKPEKRARYFTVSKADGTAILPGDSLHFNVGYGKIYLENIGAPSFPGSINTTPGLPQGVNVGLAGMANVTVPFNPKGDFKWLVLTLINSQNPPWNFTIQHLDQSLNEMFSNPPNTPTAGIEVYNADGSVLAHSGDGNFYSTNNKTSTAGVQNIFIPVCGAFQINIIAEPQSGGMLGAISGQFTNSGPGGI